MIRLLQIVILTKIGELSNSGLTTILSITLNFIQDLALTLTLNLNLVLDLTLTHHVNQSNYYDFRNNKLPLILVTGLHLESTKLLIVSNKLYYCFFAVLNRSLYQAVL